MSSSDDLATYYDEVCPAIALRKSCKVNFFCFLLFFLAEESATNVCRLVRMPLDLPM